MPIGDGKKGKGKQSSLGPFNKQMQEISCRVFKIFSQSLHLMPVMSIGDRKESKAELIFLFKANFDSSFKELATFRLNGKSYSLFPNSVLLINEIVMPSSSLLLHGMSGSLAKSFS